MLTIDNVYRAYNVLKSVVRKTDVIYAPKLKEGAQIYLKTENLQITGSFKVRGAYYKMTQLSAEEKKRGVIACSAGNHAQGVALATDIGTLTDEVSDALIGCENVILESNHDENMLLCGSYPYELKRRILSDFGHLSNEAAAVFVSHLAASGTKRILLAHLSQENNLPELAYHSSLEVLEDYQVFLGVASPNEPTKLI